MIKWPKRIRSTITLADIQAFHHFTSSFKITTSQHKLNESLLFVWLVGFLTPPSTTRLYRGHAPRQSLWQFYVLPHMRQSWGGSMLGDSKEQNRRHCKIRIRSCSDKETNNGMEQHYAQCLSQTGVLPGWCVDCMTSLMSSVLCYLFPLFYASTTVLHNLHSLCTSFAQSLGTFSHFMQNFHNLLIFKDHYMHNWHILWTLLNFARGFKDFSKSVDILGPYS